MVDHNDRDEVPDDLYDDATPRSIFAATWFRAVLVLIVLGVIGAVAVPYVLDAVNSPPGKLSTTATTPTPAPPPAAMTPTPGAPPSVAPAPVSPSPSAPAPSAIAPDKPAEKKDAMTAPMAPAQEPAKTESLTAPKPAVSAETPSKPAPKMARATTSGDKAVSGPQWFVQVGAFKDAATATKVATKLREGKYKVDESTRGGPAAMVAKATTTPSAGGDLYDVIVSGQSPTELNSRLAAKGLSAEAAPSGAVVKPSLPLRDAVALSKDLAVDGLKVQVRRAGGASAPAPSSGKAAVSAGGADGLHRVSVGGFADRATALATLKELEAKGYKPFLTRR